MESETLPRRSRNTPTDPTLQRLRHEAAPKHRRHPTMEVNLQRANSPSRPLHEGQEVVPVSIITISIREEAVKPTQQQTPKRSAKSGRRPNGGEGGSG